MRSALFHHLSRFLRRPWYFYSLILFILLLGFAIPRARRHGYLSHFDYNSFLDRLRVTQYARLVQSQTGSAGKPPPEISRGNRMYDAALTKVLDHIHLFLHNETITNHLLSPLRMNPASVVQEAASRARVYQEAFHVWQDMHYLMVNGDIQPRPDPKDQIQKLSTHGADEALDLYNNLERFVTDLGHRIFPWDIKTATSHQGDYFSQLHSSYHGRGIVMAAGDYMMVDIMTTIESLRKIDCRLPIEVFYLGQYDLSREHRSTLDSLPGVQTKDLTLLLNDSGWKLEEKGWSAKPFAILHSSFREAIFIDADAYFFSSPEPLFSSPEYTRTGTVFFKDRTLFPEHVGGRPRKAWLESILPAPLSQKLKTENRLWTGTSEHMQESGVVVVDKWRHFVALLMTARLNGPDRKVISEEILGDKETFSLAWEMVGRPHEYAFWPSMVGSLGALKTPSDGAGWRECCSANVLHFDREGKKPLWFNGGLKQNKVDDDAEWKVFEGYTREPRELDGPDQDELWAVEEANVLCLKSREHGTFTDEEARVLKTIMDLARENSVLFP